MDQVWMVLAFGVSALCAAVMGFAIQRGATCTVAAVDELVTRRRGTRLVAIVEASVWVVAGLLFERALGMAWTMPDGYAVGAATLIGGVLLGFGAYVNRACVFGAIARLGSGEWAYAVTPLGFYVGCATVARLFPLAPPARAAHASPILQGSAWLAVLAGAFVVVRSALTLVDFSIASSIRLRARPARAFGSHAWSPHAATSVIGIAFVVILLLSGAWAYTDVLAELAHGMASSLPARIGLLVALLAGAVVGGVSAGKWRNTRVSAGSLLRCFIGGLLMGWGSLLIPGSNDGLVLVGMPLLLPHAWVAFLAMCVAIAASILFARRRADDPRAPWRLRCSSSTSLPSSRIRTLVRPD
jgi:toxin CptA